MLNPKFNPWFKICCWLSHDVWSLKFQVLMVESPWFCSWNHHKKHIKPPFLLLKSPSNPPFLATPGTVVPSCCDLGRMGWALVPPVDARNLRSQAHLALGWPRIGGEKNGEKMLINHVNVWWCLMLRFLKILEICWGSWCRVFSDVDN